MKLKLHNGVYPVKRYSTTSETSAGEVQLSVKNRTRTRTKKAACQALSLPPRGEIQGINKPRRHWSHPSLHPPSYFKLWYVVLRMLQYPAISCTSGTLSVLRGISPLSKRIGVKTLQAPLLGKERMAAGKEEVGERKVRCRI